MHEYMNLCRLRRPVYHECLFHVLMYIRVVQIANNLFSSLSPTPSHPTFEFSFLLTLNFFNLFLANDAEVSFRNYFAGVESKTRIRDGQFG